MVSFIVPFDARYKNKDEHFTNFICEWLPNFLSNMEKHLASRKVKWLAGNNITLADFNVGAHVMRLAYNPRYENKHIVQTVIAKYPLSKAWAEQFRDYTQEWFGCNNEYQF